MRTLIHHPLSPFCRKIRLLLAEKDLAFETKIEKPWEKRAEFLALSPAADVPVLVEDDFVLTDASAITEYVHEQHAGRNFLGDGTAKRARVRALTGFFDRVFYADIIMTLVAEKALKRLQGSGTPDGFIIRHGYAALEEHMKHINWLSEQQGWLAHDELSMVDLTAAAHLSVVDYLGDIGWDKYPDAKAWYARIKSRPSFRPILADQLVGLTPPAHYANLDF